MFDNKNIILLRKAIKKIKRITMAEFLSQDEINALLNIADEDTEIYGETQISQSKVNYTYYDFKKPRKLSDTELLEVNIIHEKLINKFNNINLYSVELMTYEEFNLSVPEITYINELNFNNNSIILEVNPNIAEKLISSSILKGSNQEILNNILNSFITELEKTWSNIKPSTINIKNSFQNLNLTNITENSDIIVLIVFELDLEDENGFLSICYPVDTILSYLSKPKINKSIRLPQKKSYLSTSVKLLNSEVKLGNLLKFDLDFNYNYFNNLIKFNEIINSIKLGTKKGIYDIYELDTIILNQSVLEPLEVLVNDTLIGYGKLIIIDNKLGIKMKKIIPNRIDIIESEFDIIKIHDKLYIGQDNRMLFELIKVDDKYKLIELKEL